LTDLLAFVVLFVCDISPHRSLHSRCFIKCMLVFFLYIRVAFWGWRLFAIEDGTGETTRTDVPSLREDDAQEEDEQKNTGANPAVCGVGSRGIEPGLIVLKPMGQHETGRWDKPARRCKEWEQLRRPGPLTGKALTLVSLEVWAETAVKGDSLGSGTSMVR
jgi:hypothetical protein